MATVYQYEPPAEGSEEAVRNGVITQARATALLPEPEIISRKPREILDEFSDIGVAVRKAAMKVP